jgi:hypothetical protein
MSRTTDAAIEHQSLQDLLEEVYAEREELAALEWIAKNPNKAIATALLIKNGIKDALHS